MAHTNEIIKKILQNKETRLWVCQKFTSGLSDKFVVELFYKLATGKKLPLDDPKTLNEKIQWYKLYYHNPLMIKCADKYTVRDYVRKRGLSCILNTNYGVYENAKEIDFQNLPERCFIKCTHNSNGNYAWDRKKENNISELTNYFNKMLKLNAFYTSREWCYKNIKPRIIVEKYIETEEGQDLIDINIFCFNGEPKLVLWNVGLSDKEGKHAIGKRAVFDESFNELRIETAMPSLPYGSIKKPDVFDKLIEYAKKLSKPFPFVRVDFFYTGKEIFFGELTFYSAGGYGKYAPDKWNYIIGDWFVLPEKLL